ncbi:MAG TPA: ABC transporter ATP-binding protein, partial [Ktedonobacteraceae bacterium]|nr:ABC transporter ATP-binding protein [Ktedonobacteraceae bacterium]
MLDSVMNSTVKPGVKRPRTGEVVLQARNLSKKYGQRLAVDDLNLSIQRGDIFGFLGPNGA